MLAPHAVHRRSEAHLVPFVDNRDRGHVPARPGDWRARHTWLRMPRSGPECGDKTGCDSSSPVFSSTDLVFSVGSVWQTLNYATAMIGSGCGSGKRCVGTSSMAPTWFAIVVGCWQGPAMRLSCTSLAISVAMRCQCSSTSMAASSCSRVVVTEFLVLSDMPVGPWWELTQQREWIREQSSASATEVTGTVGSATLFHCLVSQLVGRWRWWLTWWRSASCSDIAWKAVRASRSQRSVKTIFAKMASGMRSHASTAFFEDQSSCARCEVLCLVGLSKTNQLGQRGHWLNVAIHNTLTTTILDWTRPPNTLGTHCSWKLATYSWGSYQWQVVPWTWPWEAWKTHSMMKTYGSSFRRLQPKRKWTSTAFTAAWEGALS